MKSERKPCVLWGVPIILTLIFALLKMTGMVTWTWPLVFWPFWVPITFGAGIITLALLIGYIGKKIARRRD